MDDASKMTDLRPGTCQALSPGCELAYSWYRTKLSSATPAEMTMFMPLFFSEAMLKGRCFSRTTPLSAKILNAGHRGTVTCVTGTERRHDAVGRDK